MEAMRKSWTDERLDDFRGETACRLDALERTMKSGFDRVDREMKAGFERVDGRIGALQRTLMQVGGGVIVALLGLIATQL